MLFLILLTCFPKILTKNALILADKSKTRIYSAKFNVWNLERHACMRKFVINGFRLINNLIYLNFLIINWIKLYKIISNGSNKSLIVQSDI